MPVYNSPPLVFYENGEAKGLFIDLLEYIAKEEGWELKYTYSTFPVLLEKLEKEEIDILPALRTLERAKLFSSSDSIWCRFTGSEKRRN